MDKVKVFLLIALAVIGLTSALAYASGGSDDHECGEEWHWVIAGIKPTPTTSSVPPKITIKWDNDTTTNVPLDKVTGGVAHYSSYDHLNDGVEPKSWTMTWKESYGTYNRFNLSHGPCGDTTTTSTEDSTTTSVVESTTTTVHESTTTSVDDSTTTTVDTTTTIPDKHIPKTGISMIPVMFIGLLLVIAGLAVRRTV